jgi:hypothetical protein
MAPGEPEGADRGDGSRGGSRRRWYALPRRAWKVLAAAVPVVAALVGVVIALLPDPDPAASGRFERDAATVGFSSLRAYLDDRRLDSSGYSADDLEAAGLRFQLPVVLQGLDGSRVLVLSGLYDRACSANLLPTAPVQGVAFVPDSQDFRVVADIWLQSGVAPPSDYCYKIALARRGQPLLFDFFDHSFHSETEVAEQPRPRIVDPVQQPPLPQILAGPGGTFDPPVPTPTTATTPTTMTTTPLPPPPPGTEVLIPTLPVDPADVPALLRAARFPRDALAPDDDTDGSPTTPTTPTAPTAPTTPTAPTAPTTPTDTAPASTTGLSQ